KDHSWDWGKRNCRWWDWLRAGLRDRVWIAPMFVWARSRGVGAEATERLGGDTSRDIGGLRCDQSIVRPERGGSGLWAPEGRDAAAGRGAGSGFSGAGGASRARYGTGAGPRGGSGGGAGGWGDGG